MRLQGMDSAGHRIRPEWPDCDVEHLVHGGAVFGFPWYDALWVPMFQFALPGHAVAELSLIHISEDAPTPLQKEVGRVGRVLGLAAVVIAVVVVATILATGAVRSPADVVRVLLLGVSLAVAAVPEGLPAILSVVLALGVQRLAARHAIVKKLASVETLGSASVIATDKTGTLTRAEMTIVRVVTCLLYTSRCV